MKLKLMVAFMLLCSSFPLAGLAVEKYDTASPINLTVGYFQ